MELARRVSQVFEQMKSFDETQAAERNVDSSILSAAKKEYERGMQLYQAGQGSISQLEIEKMESNLRNTEAKYSLNEQKRRQTKSSLEAELRYLVGRPRGMRTSSVGLRSYLNLVDPNSTPSLMLTAVPTRPSQTSRVSGQPAQRVGTSFASPLARRPQIPQPFAELFNSTLSTEAINQASIDGFLEAVSRQIGVQFLMNAEDLDIRHQISPNMKVSQALLFLGDMYPENCFVFRDYGILYTSRESAKSMYAATIPEDVPLFASPPGAEAGIELQFLQPLIERNGLSQESTGKGATGSPSSTPGGSLPKEQQ
jgi:hypothetical protein